MKSAPTKCKLIAVAGGSASGKSTFTSSLAAALVPCVCVCLSIDKYNRRGKPGAPTFVSPSTNEEEFNMNHPDAYDWERLLADIKEETTREDGADFVIVEGLMALHHEALRDAADLKIYIDLEPDFRALRRMLRDMAGGRQSTDPAFIARYYLECARVGHLLYVEPSRQYADLILRGDAEFSRVAELVAGGIGGR